MSHPRLKVPLLIIAAAAAQISLFSGLRVVGVAPDVMLLLAVAAGLAGGRSQGTVVGFASGLALDLFLQSPLGLSALTFSLVGYMVGSLQSGILRSSWWIPLVIACGASMAGEAMYALSGTVIGEPGLIGPRLLVVVGVVGVLNAALSPVALRAVGWALRSPYATPSYR